MSVIFTSEGGISLSFFVIGCVLTWHLDLELWDHVGQIIYSFSWPHHPPEHQSHSIHASARHIPPNSHLLTLKLFSSRKFCKLKNTDQVAKCLTKELCFLVFITAVWQSCGEWDKAGGGVSQDCLCVTGVVSFLPPISFLDISIVTTKNSLANLCQGLKNKSSLFNLFGDFGSLIQ